MSEKTEVAIVGGGAAGCAVAYFLAQAGVEAAIIERAGVGSQASGYSAGGLNPLQGTAIPGPLGLLAIESFRMHLGMWDRLRIESGVDFSPETISLVHVALDESDLRELDETLDAFEAADEFSARWLEGDELRELEPRIAQEAIRGLYTYGNAVLDSYLFTTALSKAAEQRGAAVRAGDVTGLKTSAGVVTGILLEGRELACDAVVLATGPWAKHAEQWLGVTIPVEPLKGEILRMELPGAELMHDFTWGHVSLFRRADGQVWVGATEERLGFDAEPSVSARQSLLEEAMRVMPSIAEARLVKHTACLRPVTRDWLPIIGRALGWDNVYIATGGAKKGILLSPAMGKATADLITEGSTQLPVSTFSPERFGGVS